MILANPLVQIAIIIFLAGVVALLTLILTDSSKAVKRWMKKWSFLFVDEDDEDECPDWADPVKWRQSK